MFHDACSNRSSFKIVSTIKLKLQTFNYRYLKNNAKIIVETSKQIRNPNSLHIGSKILSKKANLYSNWGLIDNLLQATV